jgi:hypothetical protein
MLAFGRIRFTITMRRKEVSIGKSEACGNIGHFCCNIIVGLASLKQRPIIFYGHSLINRTQSQC